MKRLKEIDGLRAVAVLGVLWAHCWMFLGNPAFNIRQLPVNRILSFGGVGVDLFFVISGFCMFYSFEKKYSSLNIDSFLNFLKKRWLRIAPVFYIAVISYSIVDFFTGNVVPIKTILLHLLFAQTLFHENHIAAHFWSLATEWHFYLILPFVFLTGKRFGIRKTVYFFMSLCLIFRFIHWGYFLASPVSIENYDRIYFRFIEFAWGILACKYYTEKRSLPKILQGSFGFLIALLFAYIGRLMNTTEAITTFKSFGFLFRVFSEPILSFGFAVMLLNVINTQSIFTKMLNSLPFQKIGKISYSFYLWHWIISMNVCLIWSHNFKNNRFMLTEAFAFSLIITYLVSIVSYQLIERRYFSMRAVKESKLKRILESKSIYESESIHATFYSKVTNDH